jgi:pimeloyl-ACP methyl ester carboxylesterase
MNTQYLKQANGQIAYDDSGSGPLIICVPGLGDLRAEYRFLIPQLVEAGYRVVSMDIRGHGETSLDWADYSVGAIGSDMLALIRALAAGPAVVLGTSMAAGAAVWAAAEAPELIAGLVLIGPFVRGSASERQVSAKQCPPRFTTRAWSPAPSWPGSTGSCANSGPADLGACTALKT